MKLALNMIVKNESARIVRALDSVAQFVDYWVITDTGSTDDTKEKIQAYFDAHHIPGELHDAPFHDWSQARNAALAHARTAWCKDPSLFDYLLLMDADMEIVVKDRECFDRLTGPSYDLMQKAGVTHYLNRRLLRADQSGQYLGVTHEFLNVDTAGAIPEKGAFFVDHADGANRPEKYKRDIRLLKQGLKDEPANERYMFYLAQSYRDAGQHRKAAEWYKRRVAAGGWDEEVWQAQVNYAHCLRTDGDEGGFIRELLVAYNLRPSRGETLYDLARHYRDKGMNAPAALFAEIGLQLPKSGDALFVNDFVYTAGLAEEFSISAFYVPAKRERGFEVTDHLALQAGPYVAARECARNNLYFYLPTLGEVCPSFTWAPIGFTPPDGWAAMNPSVTLHKGRLTAIVRCVNYHMNEHGQYIISATDGTANATNPINTRNFLVELSPELDTLTKQEVLPPGNMPCEFPLVVGFEDMRLFSWRGALWTSSTVRQFAADGQCEQVLARIDDIALVDVQRMLRTPRATEKNWAPIITGGDASQKFMWRPGEWLRSDNPNMITKRDTGMATDHISGGSQLIPFQDGYLALVHEARCLPGSHLRYYFHRFAFYDSKFGLKKLSRPFVFNEKVIEFAAGMCWHPNGQDLVISYGFKDAEARIATISHMDVTKLLWFKSK